LGHVLHRAASRAMAALPATLIASVLTALLVVACGAPTSGPSPSPAGPRPTVTVPIDMPVVISLVGAFDEQTLALLDSQIATFEETNPDIRVEVVAAEDDIAERRQEYAGYLAQGDSSRDIYLLDSAWLAKFAAEGWLLPLDDYLEAEGLTPGLFLPPTVQASTVGGRLMALPWTADAGLLYYRQDLVDEVPRTWPELATAAARLTGPAGTPYGFVW
jgi:multiple sugar transport system substrate-binding protein